LAEAFESTKVLPDGVRSVAIKSVDSSIDFKSTGTGSLEPLAQALAKELRFAKIVQGEKASKRSQLEAFLLQEGFELEAPLGRFAADMQARVRVLAPVFSYGLSEGLTLAFAIPYYQAKMGTELGFVPSEHASRLVARLRDPDHNQVQAAREASNKINQAVGELNRKLSDHGYRQLTPWQGRGFGDLTLGAKYLALTSGPLRLAGLGGLSIPTGRSDDPDVLNDVPFGKGTYDLFAGLIADQPLGWGFFLNQYAKYNYALAGQREFRMATADEAIEVEKRRLDYKIGDRIDAGASLQFEPSWGLVAGLGYVYNRKFGDRYSLPGDVAERDAVRANLEEDSAATAHYLEGKFGYSGIEAYRRGELRVPFAASLEYKKHLASANSFANDLVTVDIAVYF